MNIDDFSEIYDSYEENYKKYTKEEWREYKQEEREKVYSLRDTTAKEIVQNSQAFKQYLSTQSKFWHFSVGNALLVTAQMPEATQLKEVKDWLRIGNYPKKDCQKIKIIEAGDKYVKEDGTIGRSYNIKQVCDISQVNCRGKNPNIRYDDKLLLKVFLRSSPGKVQPVEQISDTNKNVFYNLETNVLSIAREAEVPKLFHELTQELAKEEMREEDIFKMQCVSYMLCKRYGIDVSNYAINIPPNLQNMNAKEIIEELEPINITMKNINARIDNHIKRIIKESKSKER